MSDLNLLSLTADIVSNYVQQNNVPASEVATLIGTVHSALASAGEPEGAAEITTKATPAQIRKSITPDALVSFEDGKPYKTLRRHLAKRGLTPDDYKAKWGLPKDYPLVAPSYAAKRSELAKAAGLGSRTGRGSAAAKGVKGRSGKSR